MEQPGGPREKPQRPSAVRHAWQRLAGSGTEILASILGLGIVGWAFDRWLGTGPWLMAAGLLIGTVGGMWNAIRKGFHVIREDHDRRRP